MDLAARVGLKETEANMRKLTVLGLAVVLLVSSNVQAEDKTSISNRIKWVTASELNNFGFDVLRGDFEQGPFDRINEHTIPGAGNSDMPSRYEFIDETIEAGKAYWYYVESISMSGQREKFTPTVQIKPKYPTTD